MVGLDVGMLEVKKHNGKGFIQPFYGKDHCESQNIKSVDRWGMEICSNVPLYFSC